MRISVDALFGAAVVLATKSAGQAALDERQT
jgi:hypothetical protein